MIYKDNDVFKAPTNTPIWACAYNIDNNNNYSHLKCKPVQGEIKRKGYTGAFIPYKNGTTTLRAASAGVSYRSRAYATTEKECIDLYNSLIQERIDALTQIIKDAEKEKIV